MRARLVVFTLVLGLVAHVGTATGTAAGGGFHRVSVAKAGFSIEVPRSWATLDFTKRRASALLDKLRQSNPALARVLPANFATAVASKVQLFAIDQSGGQFHQNVNVILTSEQTLPSSSSIESQLSAVASSPIDVSKTRVDGKAALVVSYTINLTSDGSLVSHVTQYLVIGSEGGLIFSFATSDAGRTNPTVKRIIRSVKL
jgi:hypothetical protein